MSNWHPMTETDSLRWWYRKLKPAIEKYGQLEIALQAIRENKPEWSEEERQERYKKHLTVIKNLIDTNPTYTRIAQEARQQAYLNKFREVGWAREKEALKFVGLPENDCGITIQQWVEHDQLFKGKLYALWDKLDEVVRQQVKGRILAKSLEVVEKTLDEALKVGASMEALAIGAKQANSNMHGTGYFKESPTVDARHLTVVVKSEEAKKLIQEITSGEKP